MSNESYDGWIFDFSKPKNESERSASKEERVESSGQPQDADLFFGKMLLSLCEQSPTRIRKVCERVDITILKQLVDVFDQELADQKARKTQALADDILKQGISSEELMDYLSRHQ